MIRFGTAMGLFVGVALGAIAIHQKAYAAPMEGESTDKKRMGTQGGHGSGGGGGAGAPRQKAKQKMLNPQPEPPGRR